MAQWPHAPPHYIGESGVYMVTASTYQRLHHFAGEERLDYLHGLLLEIFVEFGWAAHAWAVMSNHYHFVASSPNGTADSLRAMLRKLHAVSARHINREDHAEGRKVWHNFRDSRITNEKSHLARLHYVHTNPVHHQLVLTANQYRWCSAAWFERTETAARIKTVYNFPISKLLINDEK